MRIDPLLQAPEPARVTGGSVTFEPGAPTNWHTRTLVVTAAVGRVQRRGGLDEDIRPGDVVCIAPGEKHWHGAAPSTSMTHITIQERQDGSVGDGLEPVSDKQ